MKQSIRVRAAHRQAEAGIKVQSAKCKSPLVTIRLQTGLHVFCLGFLCCFYNPINNSSNKMSINQILKTPLEKMDSAFAVVSY